jgi:hypothetical protein
VDGQELAADFHGWLSALGGSDVLGTLGVIVYVGAYLALQLGFLRGDGAAFPALNLFASLSILVSLWQDFNPYSASIEIAWSVISIIGLARLYYVHHHLRLTGEEAEVARRLVPGLKKDRARQVLRLGRFLDAGAGHVLAVEGTPVPDLALLLSGHAGIARGRVEVAQIGAGALVGELTLVSGGPATATVQLSSPARLFLIERGALLAFLARNPDVASEMEQSIAGDLRTKLVQTTDRLSAQLAADR